MRVETKPAARCSSSPSIRAARRKKPSSPSYESDDDFELKPKRIRYEDGKRSRVREEVLEAQVLSDDERPLSPSLLPPDNAWRSDTAENPDDKLLEIIQISRTGPDEK